MRRNLLKKHYGIPTLRHASAPTTLKATKTVADARERRDLKHKGLFGG